jgi:hypothetical protein
MYGLRRLILAILGALLMQQIGRLPVVSAQASGITSPPDGAVVQGQVQIIGTAVHPEFLRYELFFGPCPVSGAEWCGIGDAHFEQVQNGLLGVWDTTAIPDGIYRIQMRVVKKDGNYETDFVDSLTVANTRPPTETPTPTETPGGETPTPGTPPPTLPGGTPTVIIEQPPTSTPRASATPREVAGTTGSGEEEQGGRGSGLLPELPSQEEVATFFDGARATMCWGAQLGLGAIVILGGYVALRNTLRAGLRRARRRGPRISAR